MYKTINLSRGTTSYYDIPKDDVSPVLVWLHAFPQDRTMWESQRTHFATTHRVIVPDLPGFGDSTPVEGWTIDMAADIVAELLDTLKITEPVVLGGLSMGGYTALAFARRHPGKLKALILADTKAEPDDATAKAGREKTIALAKEKGAAGVIEAMLPKIVGETTRAKYPDVVGGVIAIAEKQSTEGVIGGLKALRDRPDATPGLGKIAVPTLVIVGEEDLATPITNSERLAKEIPGAKLIVLPAVGHLSNMEDAMAFNSAVGLFLGT
ncbi:alpha/beta fold hydrolase [Zavarzinella formosa]|uniref:alpha/beta fold hydrolase n=1 Tax=Zavarzinella formosa TaxID=360055 RepID=UPI000301D37D|nr:alpha/beta fold hydrolase [Zavarzinella formosa]